MNKLLIILQLIFISLCANAQTADFTFQSSDGSFCSPSTITFNQTCTGNPVSFIWDFGNGNFGSNATENNVFSVGGTYTVTLTAIFENTVVEVSKTILINPLVSLSITADRDYICQPGVVNFTATTNGNIDNYKWNFGETPDIEMVKTNTISHSYQTYGIQKVTLTALTSTGCTVIANSSISVKKLPMSIAISKVSGCIPASVNFKAGVTLPKNSTVSTYSWDFNDGSPKFVSGVNSATNNYTSVGQYLPTVTITTNEGCVNTFNISKLSFGTPPLNHVVSSVKSTWCGSETVKFKTSAVNANKYYWDFGDGITAFINDTIISHKYATIGPKNVTVRAFFNECPSPQIYMTINIVGVVAKYNSINSCTKRNEYYFSDVSNGFATGRLWSYGDLTKSIDTSVNSVHDFPTSGQFSTKLFVTDTLSGCSDSISKILYTSTPNLFNADSVICKNTLTTFSIINHTKNPASNYTWHVVGLVSGPTTASSITINANKLGSFDNFVSINYGPGTCNDTIKLNRTILVKGPNLDYKMSAAVCVNANLSITNNSQPFVANDSIITTYWNYGKTNFKDTIYQPLPVKYKSPRVYYIKMVAIDINGCQDSLMKTVTANPLPFLRIIPTNDSICYNSTQNLIAFHNESIVWSPASTLSCINCDTVVANPLVSTRYICVSTNAFGCSVQDTSNIYVSTPFTTKLNIENIAICLNESTNVDVEPKGKMVSWSPAIGLSNVNIYNPVISPVQNTVYTVTLSDSSGCLTNSSSATLDIKIKSLPTVNLGPDKVYAKGEAYSFKPLYSNNVQSYFWSPSVLLNCSDCAYPNGINTNTQQYVVKVISDSGCVARDSVLISIECKYANIILPSAFTPNNDNLNDYFYPITSGIKMISKFIIYNRGGKVVYEASNFNPNTKNLGWNGTYKSTNISAESYVYSLEAICDLGEVLYKKGSVLLLR